MRLLSHIFLMLFFVPLSAQAELITSSSSMVDVCAGYQAGDSIVHKPLDNVTMNGFQFDQKIITIPIQLETLQALGVTSDVINNYHIEPNLGNLELHPDDSLYYQEQQIGSSSLNETCAKRAGAPLMGNEKDFIEGDSSYE